MLFKAGSWDCWLHWRHWTISRLGPKHGLSIRYGRRLYQHIQLSCDQLCGQYCAFFRYIICLNSISTLAALYSQQTTAPPTEDQSSAIYSNNKSSNWNFKKQLKGNKPKTTKSVQQLHYCEVC